MSSSRSAQSSVGVGAYTSTEPTVVKIKTTMRNKFLFQYFDLCEMSNGVDKAWCKGCGTFLKPESNSTLRSHLTKHCVVVKNNPPNDQAQMSTECGVWNFNPDMVREMMRNLIIQESLPFNHFDNPRLTSMIQKVLQPRYHQVSRSTIRRDCLKRWRQAKQELILGFQNLKTEVNLTTDVWSAPHGLPESYICVTAHWINPDSWQMMKRTIAFERFENFDILAWWKQKESQFPILSAMARDLLSVQASTVASESAFSLSGRVLSIRRTRLTPASLEICICLKDHLDAMEHIQHHTTLEGELEVEETIHEVEVEDGMTLPLSDEEQAMDEWMRNNSPKLQSEANPEAQSEN
ncbi:hypothetical protein E3N88_43079 [Mikania micrantha]|uniref:HAT C-terminal dimerisation domain-containing protein n=1 Tax=Mikania micrantha TaxID=192012 RepID=A0A5N6LFX1_9ASTR|nr:hypothetical protein E3N88_43079 [Mikania micrantha]